MQASRSAAGLLVTRRAAGDVAVSVERLDEVRFGRRHDRYPPTARSGGLAAA